MSQAFAVRYDNRRPNIPNAETSVVPVENFQKNNTTRQYDSLSELFDGYVGELKCDEYDFGDDVGREKIW
ncbi:MAG: hypothetical protein FWC89_00565 [Defluviitaleaceae bacterium]|nr:hypothetical protein [Defluviitaleaceae bacterium]